MKKNRFYTLIAIILVVGIFSFEAYLNRQEKAEHIEIGKEIGDLTNLFFFCHQAQREW